MDFDICEYCLHEESKLACGQCEKAHYCSKECQEQHWIESHHNDCGIDAPFKQRRRIKTNWEANLGGLMEALLNHVVAMAHSTFLSVGDRTNLGPYVEKNVELGETAKKVASYLANIQKMQERIRTPSTKRITGKELTEALSSIVWDIVKYSSTISRIIAMDQYGNIVTPEGIYSKKTIEDMKVFSRLEGVSSSSSRLEVFFMSEGVSDLIYRLSYSKPDTSTDDAIMAEVKNIKQAGKLLDEQIYEAREKSRKMKK